MRKKRKKDREKERQEGKDNIEQSEWKKKPKKK